ncbi:hypothetical protein [Fusobacterium varium]|uniref:hypothetical protein n=1 Tax=Fusobacterium varium TaxID=856 RepID=UPI00356AA124
MKKMYKLLLLVVIITNLSGCSAVMAAKGKKEASVSALQIGDTKNMVLAKIGYQPIRTYMDKNKQIEIYEIEVGNEPSTGRAIAHGTLDLFTLGLWEVIGTPLEATNGEKSYLTIEYEDGKLVNLHQSKTVSN